MEFQRLFPRVRVAKPCLVVWGDDEARGHTNDVSYRGVAAELPRELKWRHEEATLVLLPEEIRLRVRPVRYERRGGTTRVGFCIQRIERGEARWQDLTQVPHW